ncbi:H-NS family nucleoid-associated regulatory protein [Burkholderia territorii]|uniref:H-NS histone family protein n=1 Tax=Burkholderia territorii TaxID=1503055 RepID=UPI0007B8196A|nr:H-NS histone family protein [Burkholderia territorii]
MKTYSELLEQLDRLRKEIDIAREHEARRIAQRVIELLEENGVDVHQLSARRPQGSRRGVRPKPKYWNPDTGATWSGRGRRPRWLVGDDLDRFLIRQEDDGINSKSGIY